jgi:hypothetical protein
VQQISSEYSLDLGRLSDRVDMHWNSWHFRYIFTGFRTDGTRLLRWHIFGIFRKSYIERSYFPPPCMCPPPCSFSVTSPLSSRESFSEMSDSTPTSPPSSVTTLGEDAGYMSQMTYSPSMSITSLEDVSDGSQERSPSPVARLTRRGVYFSDYDFTTKPEVRKAHEDGLPELVHLYFYDKDFNVRLHAHMFYIFWLIIVLRMALLTRFS